MTFRTKKKDKVDIEVCGENNLLKSQYFVILRLTTFGYCIKIL